MAKSALAPWAEAVPQTIAGHTAPLTLGIADSLAGMDVVSDFTLPVASQFQ